MSGEQGPEDGAGVPDGPEAPGGTPEAAGHAGARHPQDATDGHGGEHPHGGGHDRHGGHDPVVSHGPGAPLWMLSFADMMTNLLCFFILLSAFAPTQEGVLLEDGLGSIQKALLSIGLPGALEGRTYPVQFNAGRVVYRSAASVNAKTLVEADGRILDANRDTLRQVIAQTLSARGEATLPMPLLFDADAAELTPGHRAFLDEVVRYVASGRFRIQVDGYAFEEAGGDAAAGWGLAEARARAVRDHFVDAGIVPSRMTWVGHGLLRYGERTRANAAPSAQNRYGRRAVVLTFVE